MVFIDQIALFTQFYITLPAACLFSIAIHANQEYRRGFQLNKGEIVADILQGALIWLLCWGLLKLIVWRWGDGWFSGAIYYLFYGLLLIAVAKVIKRAIVYYNAVEESIHWIKNLVRPSWDKLPCKFKGRGMAGIGMDYVEDRTRQEKVLNQNKAAVGRIANDRILLRIATQAEHWEIREYALLKVKDRAMLKQALKQVDYSQSVLLRLAGADTLEEAIERAGDLELLLQIVRHCEKESDIIRAFAKLPENFDYATIVCMPGYRDIIRLKALDRCNDAQDIRRLILKLNALKKDVLDNQIRIKAVEKCHDPEFINDIIPQLFQDFRNDDLSRIIQKCSDQAMLKKIAGGDYFTSDNNRIAAIGGIANQEFLLDLALKTQKEAVASSAFEKIDQETIEKNWLRILEQLDFKLLSPLLNKHNCCPDCGGVLVTNGSSSTRSVGAPGDSFFRTTEWYEETTTISEIRCKACRKVWRTYFE